MSILPFKNIVFFNKIKENTMSITIDNWSFNTPGKYLTETRIIYFGDDYVVLQHDINIIVIDRIKKQFATLVFQIIYRDGVYFINDKIILTFYYSAIKKYQYQIYDLNLKLLTGDYCNMMGIFNYKEKVLCITNERKIAEISINENNKFEFNDYDYANEIEDSIYRLEYNSSCYKAVKINLSSHWLEPTYGIIFLKLCSKRNIYYRNDIIYQTDIKYPDYRLKINYITDDFYYAYALSLHDKYIAHVVPISITYTKYFINSDEQDIITVMLSDHFFLCGNEYVTPSQLKFSD